MKDLESQIEKTDGASSPSASLNLENSKWKDFKDSFKRANINNDSNAISVNDPFSKSLKERHLKMISLAGCIGTGLFIGSGKALKAGGPAGVLIGWAIVGSSILCTMHALGELCVNFPCSGSFIVYSTRFICPSWSFAMSWNYALQWLVILPLELTAASMIIGYWNNKINAAAWVAILWTFIVVINVFGVKGYGEAEFWFSLIKIITIIGFMILAIVLICGGAPKGGYIGGKHWHNPGAFSHGFKGVCSVFVTAAFSYAGTELSGMAAAESENPTKVLPKAIKKVFWRIVFFYVLPLTLIGFLVPYNSEKLIGSNSYDASASPFVIAITNGGIKVLPSIMNAVILIAVTSVANASVFACSRTLLSLGNQGFAPKILCYIDRTGRPLAAVGCTSLAGLLCFLSASSAQEKVFTWMLAISGLSAIFGWGSICLSHIRLRLAMKAQNQSLDDLLYKSQVGFWGSMYGLIVMILILVAQFWIALFPIGSSPSAETFFESYLSGVVVLVCYVGHKIWTRSWRICIPLKEIDLSSAKKKVDLDVIKQSVAEEAAYVKSRPWYYRVYYFWC
ncbi:amino acid permease [Ascoidea rubescens DSM 1968]|uniref:General amino acid permease n=1 Tax=Ascoidea rubescens DSM 1968 TaxID=1344418 RepID=A0A1D2VNW0_9ASCO|nr:general amino acid permease [Ascoidea rubescens DSM 1968]ODV63286.1 general amino acid permease [Ascoidea rubescens DSM 1968]